MALRRVGLLFTLLLAGCDGGPVSPDGGGDPDTGMMECAGAPDGQACAGGMICLGGACVASECGDGYLDTDAGELCDDGNTTAFDGCNPDCTFTCQGDADCDDGNPCDGAETCPSATHVCGEGTPPGEGTACTTATVTGGVCRSSDDACVATGCGNGVVESGEDCDDGNTAPDDGCEPLTCRFSCAGDAECLDADQCNGRESCDPTTHACSAGTTLVCGDTSACTTDTCDMDLGCRNIPIDGDGDTHSPRMGTCGDDCDDTNPTVFTGAEELCDGIDNNCNTMIDEVAPFWFIDCDGDGFAASTVNSQQDCLPPATPTGCGGQWITRRPFDASSTDCRDGDATVHPGAPELCDRLDNNCSSGGGAVVAEDADDDGFAAPSAMCAGGFPKTDCDDMSSAVHPGTAGAPALLSPANGALPGVRALRPRFRWLAATGGCDPTYEIAIDDSCALSDFRSCTFPSPEVSVADIAATSFSPAADLPVNTTAPVGRRYYWRVRSCEAGSCSAWSTVRYLDIGRATYDFNGDGYSDVVGGAYGEDAGATDEGAVFIYDGRPSGLPVASDRTIENPANQPSGQFGLSVSAGDVNGDGYADLIVGAYLQDNGATNEGNAFVYHGSSTGLPTTPSQTLDNPAGQANGNFGIGVAGAGDVNGDGYGDIVVGAYNQDAGAADEGNAFVYFGSASGVPSMPNQTLDNPANQAMGNFGGRVASAGDVNGDGYVDIIIAASGQDAPSTDEGSAFVYHGGPSGVGSMPAQTLDNPANQMGGNFGQSVASAGDVNGDGYADVVVGADVQDAGATDEGNVFVYFGSASGVPSAPSQPIDSPMNQANSRFGVSAASAGDVNGDGYADLVVGAWFHDAPAIDEGNAFVYYGSASGISTTPSVPLDNPANQGDGRFGFSVASAGDLNGDGYSDVVVGAYTQDNGATDEGNAFVYHGSSSGLPMTPNQTLDGPGNQAMGYFGYTVASAEDVMCQPALRSRA